MHQIRFKADHANLPLRPAFVTVAERDGSSLPAGPGSVGPLVLETYLERGGYRDAVKRACNMTGYRMGAVEVWIAAPFVTAAAAVLGAFVLGIALGIVL